MLNKNISELRKARGLTQAKFAEALHVTQAAVSQWETGKTNPDVQQMFIIADFFGITVEELSGVDIPVHSSPAPKVDIMFRSDVPYYLEKLSPKNRALLEEMARKLFELQQQEEKK